MFRRLHTRTEWDNLFCCGESTVLGTGTPTVTTSGLSAANAVLKKLEQEPFVYREGMKNYVRIVDKPFTVDKLFEMHDERQKAVMNLAMHCRFCEFPSCTKLKSTDVRGIMRRVAASNFSGARKCWNKVPVDAASLTQFEVDCVWANEGEKAVEISQVIAYLNEVNE